MYSDRRKKRLGHGNSHRGHKMLPSIRKGSVWVAGCVCWGHSPWLCLGTVSSVKWAGQSETHCSPFSQALETHNCLPNLNQMTVLEKQVARGALSVFVSQWQHCVNSYQELYGHRGGRALERQKTTGIWEAENPALCILRHLTSPRNCCFHKGLA